MVTMKQWLLVAILALSGTSVFIGCANSNSDNPANEDNLSEKIIGKWMLAEYNGEPALTNLKTVESKFAALKPSGSKSGVWLYGGQILICTL